MEAEILRLGRKHDARYGSRDCHGCAYVCTHTHVCAVQLRKRKSRGVRMMALFRAEWRDQVGVEQWNTGRTVKDFIREIL